MSSSAARYFPAALGKAIQSESTESQTSSTALPNAEVIEQRTGPSDESLIARICGGDAEALACLFRRYARTVRRVVYRILRNSPEADDLVQEIFLLVHRECKAFDASKSPARFWILQMAYRRAISRRRYLSSRHFYSRIDLDEAAEDSNVISNDLNELIEQSLENNRLNKVFAALSDDQQKTLRLFFIEGYTFEEIAGKLGQSRGNIKHHYFRGLEKLRKELFGGELPGERAI